MALMGGRGPPKGASLRAPPLGVSPSTSPCPEAICTTLCNDYYNFLHPFGFFCVYSQTCRRGSEFASLTPRPSSWSSVVLCKTAEKALATQEPFRRICFDILPLSFDQHTHQMQRASFILLFHGFRKLFPHSCRHGSSFAALPSRPGLWQEASKASGPPKDVPLFASRLSAAALRPSFFMLLRTARYRGVRACRARHRCVPALCPAT